MFNIETRFSGVAAAIAFAAIVGAGTAANAAVITFDDITTGDGEVADGYAGFDWANFYQVNSVNVGTTYGANGYTNGTVSPSNVGYNGFGAVASFGSASIADDFTLSSFYLTAAWSDGLSVLVEGFNDGISTFSALLNVSTLVATQFTLNWAGIDSVSFSSFGGVYAGYAGSGTHFAVDNIGINVATVPLPATLPLLGGILAALGGISARRRAKRA